MKRVLVFLLILSICGVSNAQKMLVHNSDGSIDEYETTEVDSITFLEDSFNEGLLGFYPFKNNANDVSGNANHGTVGGNPTISNFLSVGNNSSDLVSLPYEMADGLTDFTFSSMLKINTLHNSSSGSGHSWISCTGVSNWGGNALNFFYMPTLNAWRVVLYPPGVAQNTPGTGFNFDSGTVMENNDWHHVVVTRDSNEVKCYIDGQQVGGTGIFNTLALTVEPSGFVVGQEQDYVSGGYSTDQSWAGNVDNLRIYGKALTDEEVQLLFSVDGY